MKESYFLRNKNMKSQRVTKLFGPLFQDLIEKLYGFFRKHIDETDNHPDDQKYPFEENLAASQEAALKDYAEVIQYFDDAIEAIKEDPIF